MTSSERLISQNRKEREALIYVEYRDHVLFRNCNPTKIKPTIRRSVGWLISEDHVSICICFDLPIETQITVDDMLASGLSITKKDIIELYALTPNKQFKPSKESKYGKLPQKMEK